MTATFMNNAELFPRWLLPNAEDLRALKALTVLRIVAHDGNTGRTSVVWEKESDSPNRKDE